MPSFDTLAAGQPLPVTLAPHPCALRARLASRAPSRLQVLLQTVRELEHRHGAAGHARRVRAHALRVASLWGMPAGERAELGLAALLHDIGKVCVPDPILRKPGPLTPGERLVIQRHPCCGAALVRTCPALHALAQAVRHHHERWDGSGYPDGLAGAAIPLAARIIAVADVWDALTHDRPYRRALPVDEARAILVAGRHAHFEAGLVDCLLELV